MLLNNQAKPIRTDKIIHYKSDPSVAAVNEEIKFGHFSPKITFFFFFFITWKRCEVTAKERFNEIFI